MTFPEVGKFAVEGKTGNVFLIFRYARNAEDNAMVRLDEPLEMVYFGERLRAGFELIELPEATKNAVFERYKAIRT